MHLIPKARVTIIKECADMLILGVNLTELRNTLLTGEALFLDVSVRMFPDGIII